MACSSSDKRITVKMKHPNPLFEKWLTEWRDSAKERDSKMQHCFAKALQSLKKYPLPLQSGRDCKILKGFGDKLCVMLDQKLKEHNESHNSNGVVDNENKLSPTNDKTVKSLQSKVQRSPKRSRKSSEYVPVLHSGAHAILETLYKKSLEPTYPGYLTKVEIVKYGQHLCDKSFTKPEPGSFYTAWSSMRTLLNKNLVTKHGNPPKFTLTSEGVEIAKKLSNASVEEDFNMILDKEKADVESATSASDDVILCGDLPKASSSQSSLSKESISSSQATDSQGTSSTITEQEEIIFYPSNFDIFLLIDKQEISGKTSTCQDDPIIDELIHHKVPFEVRHLKVGDYIWIARDRGAGTNKELVLPYIIERKRFDDFGQSIKDGRFHEQKFRLKHSGIQNLIYLVENYGNNQHHIGLPLSTIYQAATNTLIQDGFSVKFTYSWKKTAEYLACMTSLLKNIFGSKTLMGCPKNDIVEITTEDEFVLLMTFNEFNKSAAKQKPLTVKDLFIKQLLQLKGVSLDKALAIVEKYPTPKLLWDEYKKTPEQGEKLLLNIPFGKLNKKIGPVISKTIYELYTREKFS